MPGDVWWRTWRTLPPKRCSTDPDYSVAGPVAGAGVLADLHRPAVRQEVQRLGGPLHLPRDLADVRADLCRRDVRGADGEPGRARDDVGPAQLRASTTCAGPQVQEKYATQVLHYPVWGMSPLEHGGRHRGLRRLRRRGTRVSRRRGLGAVHHLRHREHGQPARVGDRAAGAGVSRPTRTSRRCGACTRGSTPPTVGSTTRSTRSPAQVGHRRLVLDQSMIMAALDDALNDDALQRYFARDPVSWAARLYLSYETMSIGKRTRAGGRPPGAPGRRRRGRTCRPCGGPGPRAWWQTRSRR